jgi:hypothetical protein
MGDGELGNARRLQRHCLFRPELKLAMFVFFGPRLNLATGHAAHLLKHARANFIDRLGTITSISETPAPRKRVV